MHAPCPATVAVQGDLPAGPSGLPDQDGGTAVVMATALQLLGAVATAIEEMHRSETGRTNVPATRDLSPEPDPDVSGADLQSRVAAQHVPAVLRKGDNHGAAAVREPDPVELLHPPEVLPVWDIHAVLHPCRKPVCHAL